jgi:hypothetical protein
MTGLQSNEAWIIQSDFMRPAGYNGDKFSHRLDPDIQGDVFANPDGSFSVLIDIPGVTTVTAYGTGPTFESAIESAGKRAAKIRVMALRLVRRMKKLQIMPDDKPTTNQPEGAPENE